MRKRGLVYAGVTKTGIGCVQRLQKSWEAGKFIELPEILEKAHSIFKEEYAASTYQQDSLVFMLGIYDSTSDQPRLFGYQFPNFDTQEIKGVNAIGSRLEVRKLYKQRFDEFVEWR